MVKVPGSVITSIPEPSNAPMSRTNKGKEESEESASYIDKQINDLIKKRAKLRKQNTEDSVKNKVRERKDSTPRSYEKPLPQRTPKAGSSYRHQRFSTSAQALFEMLSNSQ